MVNSAHKTTTFGGYVAHPGRSSETMSATFTMPTLDCAGPNDARGQLVIGEFLEDTQGDPVYGGVLA